MLSDVRPRKEEPENAKSSLGVKLGVYAERHVFDCFPQDVRTKLRWTTSTGHCHKGHAGGVVQENMLAYYEPQRHSKTYKASMAPNMSRLCLESYSSFAERPNLDYKANCDLADMFKPKPKVTGPAMGGSKSMYGEMFPHHGERSKQAAQKNQKPPKYEALNIFGKSSMETRPWSHDTNVFKLMSPQGNQRPQTKHVKYARHCPGALETTYSREHTPMTNPRKRSSALSAGGAELRRCTTAPLPGGGGTSFMMANWPS